MIFSWFRNRRRRKILARPMPDAWLRCLENDVAYWGYLSDDERARLLDIMRIFIAEKDWIGCAGLEVTDEMKAAIAAQACLLILNVQHDYYGRVETIMLYPAAYRSSEKSYGPGGVVQEGGTHLGEAWYRGPIILSWADVQQGAQRVADGHNVVFHEFAHKLDMMDGLIDGTPPLSGREQYARWAEIINRDYDWLVERSEKGRAALLDEYGATHVSEFFAVATECFFERGKRMRKRHSELYEVLRDYYQQDPAEWQPPRKKTDR